MGSTTRVRLVPRAGAAAGAALSLAWLWDVHVPLSVALRHSEAVVACVIALGAVWFAYPRMERTIEESEAFRLMYGASDQ